ncbi:hypothetical protein SEA_HUWBERT_112 [Microbacterium phage Huwbert]|nr:hypothetical protein SEA_HUWBERT_4 [Microbacterium phage Huwbert]WNO27861.1 hypothetical protein SEA_HUWBERT_112 [Microbacterium phage Huwbert]
MKFFQKRRVPIEEFQFKRKADPQVMVLQGETATATRAMAAEVRGMLPTLQFKFRVRHGFDAKGNEEFDEVWIEMPMAEAGKFIDQALSSYQAAMPRMPRIARQTQYGE